MNSIIAITIIITIINNSLSFSCMNFEFIRGYVVNLFEFSYFLLLWICQKLRIILNCLARCKRILNTCVFYFTHFLHCQFISLRCLRNYLALFLDNAANLAAITINAASSTSASIEAIICSLLRLLLLNCIYSSIYLLRWILKCEIPSSLSPTRLRNRLLHSIISCDLILRDTRMYTLLRGYIHQVGWVRLKILLKVFLGIAKFQLFSWSCWLTRNIILTVHIIWITRIISSRVNLEKLILMILRHLATMTSTLWAIIRLLWGSCFWWSEEVFASI